MKKKIFSLVLGVVLLILVGSSNIDAKSTMGTSKTLTPSEMKSGLSEKELKRATPLEKKKKNTDDIGMPIKGGKNKSSNIDPKSYPNVNQYILSHNFQRPGITYDLHQFSMFNYGTNDNRPTGVVVHYTANPNNFSARSEADYEINGGWRSAFVHTFIDAGTILNIHDTDYGAWGCGPVGNNYFTQFEMVTARNFDDFAKTTSYSAWYTAYLLNKYNLAPSLAQANGGKGTIWSHHDVSNYLGGTDHTDPTAYFAKYGYSMSQFYELVKYYYNKIPANLASLNSTANVNGELNVKGWHIAQESSTRPYSYLFLLDPKTHAEVTRIKINRTRRDDVYNAYPNIYNSRNSGFDANFKITSAMYGKKYILMSRYSSDPSGNGNNINFIYRNLLTMPQSRNLGSLDSSNVDRQKINVKGWHITNQSEGKPYSYLFLLDAKTKKEVKRIKIGRVSRPDVQKAYSDVYDSLNSGFNADFQIDSSMYNKKYILMSRYSANTDGNGNSVDFVFPNVIDSPKIVTKASSMDTFTVTNKNIHVKGWQVDNESLNKPYSYAILIDIATGREYKRIKFNRTQRSDVQAAYPEINNSLNSGFNIDIPVTNEMRGHSYKVLMRYSDGIDGNGSNADVTFNNIAKIPALEKGNYGSLNEFSLADKQNIYARGWQASSESIDKPYSFLFLLDAKTKGEVKRYPIGRISRPDVGEARPNIYNSDISGFDTKLKLDEKMYGKQYILMSRYSNDPNGNGKHIDFYYNKVLSVPGLVTKASSLDSVTKSASSVNIKGWQADNNSANKSYSYLILLDSKTGAEYKRYNFNRVARPDVQNAYPEIYNSLNSGFNVNVPITEDMRNRSFRILVRYSTESSGNGINADIVFNNILSI